jgi:hypothetical protein
MYLFIYAQIICYMFRPIYRSSSGIHICTVNQVIFTYIKFICLNTDPYCATGVNVADEYINRMTASFYRVLKPDAKWLR